MSDTGLSEKQRTWILEAEKHGALSVKQKQWLDGARQNGIMPTQAPAQSGGSSYAPIPAVQNNPEEKEMTWGEVGSSAVENIGPSAGEFLSDMVQPIIHPIDTAKTLGSLGLGVLQKLVPGEQADEATADAVGQFLVDRYGSIEGVKKTLATDPVGALADVSALLTGGGTLAAKAPGKIGSVVNKAGRVANKVGNAIEPVSWVSKGVKKAGGLSGNLLTDAIGSMGTHTGGESLRLAADAGAKGGRTAERFLDNMRGNVPVDAVLGDVKQALSKMKQERSQAYRSGMAGIKADKTVLDFTAIDKAVRDVAEIGTYRGKKINRSADAAWTQIADLVDEWRMSDPADFHTAEGLDALKQSIQDVAKSYDYGSPSRIVADKVYHTVKQQITGQAPEYAKVMKDYETASGLLKEIEKTLSANPKAQIDTQLRKIQSVMRNNVNTNYGRRVDLVNKMDDVGGRDISTQVAGQSLNDIAPRGLGKLMAGVTAASSVYNPATLPLLIAQSPRLMGEAYYYGGKAGKKASDATGRIAEALNKHGPTRAKALRHELFQAGRIQDDEQERKAIASALMSAR